MITDDKQSRVNFFCAFFIWSDPPGLLCSLQPLQRPVQCPALAPCRQGIAPCRCSLVVCSCPTLQCSRWSILGLCTALPKEKDCWITSGFVPCVFLPCVFLPSALLWERLMGLLPASCSPPSLHTLYVLFYLFSFVIGRGHCFVFLQLFINEMHQN